METLPATSISKVVYVFGETVVSCCAITVPALIYKKKLMSLKRFMTQGLIMGHCTNMKNKNLQK